MTNRLASLSLAALAACAGVQPAAPPLPLPPPPDGAGAPAAAAAALGPPTVLLASGRHGLAYFPDTAPTVISPPPNLRMLAAAGTSTALLEGTDLEHLTGARKVLGPGKRGSADNGYAGASGAVEAGGALFAAYHGEDQEGMPMVPGTGGVPGFHASVGLASSPDGGRTFVKLGSVVTSARPKGWHSYPGQVDSGAGEPWLMRSRDGAWWLLYYVEHSREGGRGVQICLARAPASASPAPGAFRKWYQGAFTEPGLGGRDTPVLSAQPFDQGDSFAPQVVYSDALGVYVMVLNLNAWKEYVEGEGLHRSGIYLATSSDGVHWSRPEPLFIDWAVTLVGRSVSWHPAIVFDPGSSTRGWLLYGHTDLWNPGRGGTPHHLWGRRIELAPRK